MLAAGVFWQTRFNGAVMGHGGHDPGVQAEMLASHDRRIGVVILSNASLSGEEAKAVVAIHRKLWERAEALRAR